MRRRLSRAQSSVFEGRVGVEALADWRLPHLPTVGTVAIATD